MPVSRRAVGWVTGVFLALGGTAVFLGLSQPDPTHAPVLVDGGTARLLEVSFIVVSSWVGGLTAGAMCRGVKRSGTWPVVVRSIAVGVIVGVATFFLLAVTVAVVVMALLGNSGFSLLAERMH